MTTTRWLVAKYIPDLRRGEPENIGVVLLMNGRAYSRFFGQRTDGKVDGRVVARSVGSFSNYKAWIEYWTRTISATPTEKVTEVLTARSGGENYVVEIGGERILGSRSMEPDEMLDYLYTTLVDQSSSRTAMTVARLSERIFETLQIRDRVTRDFTLELGQDAIPFDYRYDNGQANLMQRVSLASGDERSWDSVHVAAYAAQRAAKIRTVEGKGIQVITLVRPREPDRTLDRQLGVLSDCTHVVDLSNAEIATGQLARLLHVGRPVDAAGE